MGKQLAGANNDDSDETEISLSVTPGERKIVSL
jgi:hypothetical protein